MDWHRTGQACLAAVTASRPVGSLDSRTRAGFLSAFFRRADRPNDRSHQKVLAVTRRHTCRFLTRGTLLPAATRRRPPKRQPHFSSFCGGDAATLCARCRTVWDNCCLQYGTTALTANRQAQHLSRLLHLLRARAAQVDLGHRAHAPDARFLPAVLILQAMPAPLARSRRLRAR